MKRFLDEFIMHAALGMMAVICLPLAIAVLPFWCIGKVVGRYLDAFAN